eukprot:5478228-Prymnesium_polylepis.1
MQEVRAAGRAVVLCGDLNIAWRPQDAPWKLAMVPSAALCDLTSAAAAATQAADAQAADVHAAAARGEASDGPAAQSEATFGTDDATPAEGAPLGPKLLEALGGAPLPDELLRRARIPVHEIDKEIERRAAE